MMDAETFLGGIGSSETTTETWTWPVNPAGLVSTLWPRTVFLRAFQTNAVNNSVLSLDGTTNAAIPANQLRTGGAILAIVTTSAQKWTGRQKIEGGTQVFLQANAAAIHTLVIENPAENS